MPIPVSAIVDFGASLALLGMLALAYRTVRRRMPGVRLAPTLLGVLFGGVAVLQMHAPIMPQPGLLIDLRNVPVILAGAFLGIRGLLVCIAVAAAGRIGIGGIGWSSGVTAMILCGAGGFAWNALCHRRRRRGIRALIGLWLMTVPHVASLVLLPRDMALWYLTVPMPALLAIYLVSILIVGALLESERARMDREARQRDARLGEGRAAFPGREALEGALAQATATGRFDGGVSVLRLRMRPGFAQSGVWGEDLAGHVLAVLHDRIAPLVPEGGEAGLARDDILVVVLPVARAPELDLLAARLRDDIAREPIRLEGTAAARPSLRVERADYADLPGYATLLDGQAPARGTARARDVDVLGAGGDPRLFDMADRLLALHDDASGRRRRA